MSQVTTTPQRGSDYSGLSQQVKAAGLLGRRTGYYAVKIGVSAALMVAGWVAFFLIGDSWYQLLLAVALGVIFTQIAFIGHEAGHRQIARTRRGSEIIGLLCGNLSVGLSHGWWIDKHNRHHANPNHEDDDPDVGAGALVWTEDQARARHGLGRVIARGQAYLFFPMLTLEGLNLRYASVRAVLRAPIRHRVMEGVLLGVHIMGYLGALLLVLSPLKAVVFLAVHQAVHGVYLGCSFAPNHKGMPMLTAADKPDYLRRQVLTSRNVRGGPFVDILLGGLNYQIEHHLFPSMPTPNLRRVQPLVRAYCAERDIPYAECGLLHSYRLALRHLHDVTAVLRRENAVS